MSGHEHNLHNVDGAEAFSIGLVLNSTELVPRLTGAYLTSLVRQREAPKSLWPMVRLGDYCTRIFNPPRFKRPYVADPELGVPYVTGAGMMRFGATGVKYLSKYMADLPEYQVKTGWVCVTDSGTIGNTIIVPPHMEGWAITNNVIRIIPKEELHVGYVYAYLTTPEGQAALTHNTYGSVIDHIEPHHVEDMRIPWPDKEIRDAIGSQVVHAEQMKAEAQKLLVEAKAVMQEKLYGYTSAEDDSGEEMVDPA
jgi:type I restriction enzyme S subunit